MDKPIPLGNRRELFVDGFLVAEMNQVRLDLKKPERREVVFTADAAWEDAVSFPLSFFQDGPIVRFYYRAGIPNLKDESVDAVALADSMDGGMTFTRPNLGLVDFRGCTANNLLRIGGPPNVPPAFLDSNPACRPGERYKGLSQKWMGLFAMASGDGLHWKSLLDGPVKMEGAFDTVNTAFWDSLAGCYRSYTRNWLDPQAGYAPAPKVKAGFVRGIQSSTSKDFIHWTPPMPNQYADGEPATHLYTNATLPCPGAEHLYLSFPNRFIEHRKKRPEHPYPGTNDALFMSSRDGVHWSRFLEAWVRPGLDPGNWTERNNYPAWGLIETSPTEWSMYITERYRHPSLPTRVRRLALRPHGFVSVHAGYAAGEFLTKPLTFTGRQLRLNYSTSAAGSIRCEIQDTEGRAFPGFTLEETDTLFGDEVDGPVTWKGSDDLSALVGKAVQLRFGIEDADLFALRFV
ncbi:MAG: hypothetical protein HYU36_04625 [Planctomycetes bacterium]|nr:hypothetical protein [Planctomycetota bacterium]